MPNLRLLIVDDHGLMLRAIAAALSAAEDMEIVGEVRDGGAVLPALAEVRPDVVLLDLHLPGVDGLALLDSVRERHPDVKLIVLSGMVEPDLVETVLERGASAFVAKHIDPRDLAAAIRQAVAGPARAIAVPDPVATETPESGLSPRELEILEALARGLSNRQIARELELTEHTVKFYCTNLYRKLDVGNRTEAVRFAYRRGLLDSPVRGSA